MFPNQEFDISKFSDEQLLDLIRNNPEVFQIYMKLKSKYDLFVTEQKKNVQPQTLKTKPLTNAEYLKLKDIKEYLDHEGGMMIEPTQCFVLKAFDENGEKVFFNVTSHSVVDAPEEKQLIDYNNEVGIRVPMSVGSVKEDHDVKGDVCKVIDLVINPQVAENLTKDDNLKTFFCQLVQTFVLQKYKLKLQDKFISLKLKYKGKSTQFQRVKGKKPPKVEVIDEKTTEQPKQEQQDEDETEKIRRRQREQFEKQSFSAQETWQVAQEPEWELFLIYDDFEEVYDGDINFNQIKQFRFQILTPLLMTGKGIKIKVNSEQFQMTAGKFYKLSLKFPMNIQLTSVKAKFIVEKRTLWISADVLIISSQVLNEKNIEQQENEEKTENEEQLKVNNKKNIELESNLIFDIV